MQEGLYESVLTSGLLSQLDVVTDLTFQVAKEQVLNRFPNYTGAEQSHADSAPPVFCHGKYSERVSKRES